MGDLVRVDAGDQVVADGRARAARGLRSTSRSSPASRIRAPARRRGAALGVVLPPEGVRTYAVTAVGAEAATRTSSRTSRATFRHPLSPLELSLNRLLLTHDRDHDPALAPARYALCDAGRAGCAEAVSTAVAGIVTLVPEGLVLLASLMFAVAAAARRPARRARPAAATRSSRSPRLEVSASTRPARSPRRRSRSRRSCPPPGSRTERSGDALGATPRALGARNPTLDARAATAPAPPRPRARCRSRRGGAGARRVRRDRVVLGAPELLRLGPLTGGGRGAAHGRRVVAMEQRRALLRRSTCARDPGARRPPASPRCSARRRLWRERLRPDARETVAYFPARASS